MAIEISRLGPEHRTILHSVAPGVFDHAMDARLIDDFLNDPRHHLIVARDSELVVGFVSGVHYIHPDKPAELWINEIGVAPSHQRQGVAKKLLAAVLDLGRNLGARHAWVLTDRSNTVALQLYRSVGGITCPSDTVMFSFDLESDVDRRDV